MGEGGKEGGCTWAMMVAICGWPCAFVSGRMVL